MYVLPYGQSRKPQARERARVTMATRMCARVEHVAFFYYTKAAVLAWKPKWALSGGRLSFQGNVFFACSLVRAIQQGLRARTRAGDHGHAPMCERKASLCVVQNNRDAMFALAPKGTLRGGRLDFQVNMVSSVFSLLWAMQSPARANARGWRWRG